MYGVLSAVNMKPRVFLTFCHVDWWMCANISKETAVSVKAGISPNLMMETAGSSEMLIHQHKHTIHHISKWPNIYIYICVCNLQHSKSISPAG